ncbi:MAG: helix-turn-helix transcriptional regulator [Lentisphaeria bacterium]|nr:helix-turn-helix transcriptional regulator [Lentisphaeria bacterium]
MLKKNITESGIVDLYPHNIRAVGKAQIGVSRKTYSVTREKWHRHNGFYEIVICCGGSAYCEDVSGSFMLRPGNVLFFNEGAVHRYTGIRAFRYYNLLFGPELFGSVSGVFSFLPHLKEMFLSGKDSCVVRKLLEENDLSALVAILETMRSEQLSRRDGWEDAMFAECSRALIFLMRHCLDEGRSATGAFQIGKAVRLMENSAGCGMTVRQVAAAVKMSESSFRHRFLAMVGISPMEFLIRQRLHHAVMALAANMSISETAEHSGFKDVNYFCRQFRSRFDMTPLTCRRKIQSGEIDPSEMLDFD